jgi:hypothetical protein
MKVTVFCILAIIFFNCCLFDGLSSSICCLGDDKNSASEIQKMSEEELRAALEKSEIGQEDERLLLEIVRRGGDGWKQYLATRYDACMKLINSPLPANPSANELLSRIRLNSLNLLTALRRIQNKPAPLQILVAGKLELTYPLHRKPSFTILIVNLDEEKQAVYGFTRGGNDRSGRLARWRFEVRDEKGEMLPIESPPNPFIGGGICGRETLEYGESWKTELPLGKYVNLTAPGKYRVRLFYHNQVEIVDSKDISDLITFQSAEIKLEVTPLNVIVTDNERQNARRWISELPDAGPVKMEMGGIVESEEFLDPLSPAGRLQSMYTSAVPDLIDAALDENLKPGQCAWVLGLLFAITGHNDPRPRYIDGVEKMESESNIIGAYEYVYSGGRGSFHNGSVSPEKQRAFAERWRVWKTNQYYIIGK